MDDAPCGCETAAEWERRPDEDPGKRVMLAQAEEDRARWRCPGRDAPPDTDPSGGPLPPECVATLEAVDRLTGCGTEMRTCPVWYARAPWVRRAVAAWSWFEKGQLQLREPDPPQALIDAVDAVAVGVSARRDWDAEHPPKPHERDHDG